MEKPLKRTLATSTTLPPSPPPDEAEDDGGLLILKPTAWLIKIIAFQLEFVSYCLSSLSIPLFAFLSMASESLHRADLAREKTEDAVHAASRVPSRVAEGGELFFKKIGFGFLGAVYVGLVLVAVMCVAVLIGVGLVRMWVEEPVILRETVHFDYTEVHPTAVLVLGGGGKKKRTIPAGHTFYVSLVMLMPESDFNHQIGVFQVTAEIISRTGNIIARTTSRRSRDRRDWSLMEVVKDSRARRVDREVSDLTKKWERIRRKRKALFPEELFTETVGSSTSSVTFTREDMSSTEVVHDSGVFADEESVCLGG
ncbi:Adipose-regulatory protein [Macleaya cordata]|uniref:Adipose-regulatory protein n=1 Tax=Macleaya cordata TaxID=56857 RepID=A0A200R8P2_MACCD|nr:Adipose-regulatory protein [Macleaya cordata]